jgi:flagellar biosynthesis protein FliR
MALLDDWSPAIVPAAAVCARMVAAVAVGTLPLGPVVPLRARGALAIALAVVALPQAVRGATPAVAPLAILSEALIGLGLGLAVAACVAAAAWAGGIIGSVTGLAWADDFTPEGDPQDAGLARLAWWLGLAGFFAAGGHLAVVAGFVDSVRMIPAGTSPAALADTVAAALGVALGLALRLAGPALVAVAMFHLAVAVGLRVVRFTPGAGMLQAAAAAVALCLVVAGLPTWLDGFGAAARVQVERSLAAAHAAPQ